ncbi:FHA domain-containing protein [Leptolyngbya sp. FACHB-541]|uniref:FHA domain-containing protein n=1 Tax=Leptolyngbya sp. FACHB-541 TaxID=2692810 RepID=UPI001689438E|nr:FHA domain-containing protein [Leptolyngbya sp. FACHB-541]MBD1998707.1 FHA domain-containing protein [Leptolyngbya sp. FACHB-541]
MNQLTLQWVEAGHVKTYTIADKQQSINSSGGIRIGRDPVRCDLVLTHPTVSGLHVEIFYNPQHGGFYLRNLRDTNPPLVNRQKLTEGEVALRQGTSIYLGQVELQVVAIASSVANTVAVPPPTATTPVQPTEHPAASRASTSYGLKCPRCHQVSPYERLSLGCPWCGTSLAAAVSVLMVPGEK